MSMDSQFNPLGDFARDEPYQGPYGSGGAAAANNNGPTVSDFSLKSNSLFSNVVHNIKDLIVEMRLNASYFDLRGADLEKTCESIIS